MERPETRSVVVTGASSGIGRACVSHLKHVGWRVFASVRKSRDCEDLQSEFSANVTPMIMDVTNRGSVLAAADQVSSELAGHGLDGLVNVAGIGMVRPIEYATPIDLQEIFNINVFGQIAVTQAFLPLLRTARGRIVNITSVGVHLPIPFGGLLNASKSAFAMFSDTMRLELRPFGIRVCTVEPGAIRTPAVEKTLGNIEAVIGSLPHSGAAHYGHMLREFVARGYPRELTGSPPDVVARAVHDALTSRWPKIRYVVGKHAKLLSTLPRILPDPVLDALLLRVAGMPTKIGAALSEDERRFHNRAARHSFPFFGRNASSRQSNNQ